MDKLAAALAARRLQASQRLCTKIKSLPSLCLAPAVHDVEEAGLRCEVLSSN